MTVETNDPMGIIDSFGNGSGTGGAGGYTNQVYLGAAPAKTVKMKKTGQTFTVPAGDKAVTIQEAQALYLTDETLRKNWLQTLKKNGLPTDPIKARALWDTAVAGASDWYATSNGAQKVTPEQYLKWYVGGAPKAENIPSRSIYQYAPEQLGAKADEIAQSVLGRAITDADKAASWYANLNTALNDMTMQGTVTTTQKVKNPKTGKMENVTIQKPEVTNEAITQKITSALKEADPVSAERKQNLDIEKWFLSMRGKSNG